MTSLPYDIKFTISGVEYGFMLSKDEVGNKALQVGEVSPPTGGGPRAISGESEMATTFGDVADIPFAQGDFTGGVGLREMSPDSDTTRYWWSNGIITHCPGKMMLPPPPATEAIASGAVAMAGFKTFLASTGTRYDFHWQGPRLYRRDASNQTNDWVLVWTEGSSKSITDFWIFNGKGYICTPSLTGTTDFYLQADPTAAATWTPTATNHAAFSDALGKPVLFRSVRGWMYAIVNNNKVFFNSDPSADSWTGPITTSLADNYSGPPGDTTNLFQGATVAQDFLLLFKEDAGYNVDSEQEVHEVIWQYKDKPSVKNFEHVATGGNFVFYSVSPEVYAYDPATGFNMPVGMATQSGFSTEDILGVGADNTWLYVLAKIRVPTLRSASCAALLRGKMSSSRIWNFEVLWEDTSIGTTSYYGLGVAPAGTSTRLYIFEDDGTDSYLLDISPNFDGSTVGSYASSGVLYTSIWRTAFPDFVKRWLWISSRTEGLSATETFNVAYSTDFGATFTSLVTKTAAALALDNFSAISADHVVLRFTLASAGTATPVLDLYSIHGRPRWRYLEAIMADVRIADNLEDLNGARDNRAATTLTADLDTIRRTNGTILYEDYMGRSFNVSVDKIVFGPAKYEPQGKSQTHSPEQRAGIVLTRSDSGN